MERNERGGHAYSGFVNGDTASVLTGSRKLSTTATESSPAGSYPITVALGTLSAANYDFNMVNGTLKVTPQATLSSPSFGLTIITHGFQRPAAPLDPHDPFPEWARAMGVAITNRIGVSMPIYRAWFKPLTSEISLLDGGTGIDMPKSAARSFC